MSKEKDLELLENEDSIDDIFPDGDESDVIDELAEMYGEAPASEAGEPPSLGDVLGGAEAPVYDHKPEPEAAPAPDAGEQTVPGYEENEDDEEDIPPSEEIVTKSEVVREAVKAEYAPQPAPVQNVMRVYEKKTEVRTEKKRAGALPVFNTVVSVFTLCVLAAGAFFGLGALRRINDEVAANGERLVRLEAEQQADYAEVINVFENEKEKEETAANEITIENGKILLYDSTVGYTWSPIISGIPLNDYDVNGFTLSDDNRMTYTVDGEESSYFGIDVSSYQKDIDWNAVRADGVEFAILRIGVRGYGEEGNIKRDEYFDANYSGAHAAGIDVGVYFFSQAITVDEAIEEAKLVLEWLDGRKLEYPVVFDWEPAVVQEDDVARTEDLMPQTLTLSAIAFCETVREAGYDAMIYTNKKLAVLKYDMRQLSCYPVWLASYRPELTYPYDFDIWQYGLGYVDGIEGEVDFNIAIIK